MLNRFTLAIVAMSALVLPLPAQIGLSAGTGGMAGVGGRGVAGAGNVSHLHHARPVGRGSVFLPYPYYDSDFGYDSQPPAPPQVVVAPAVAPTPAPPPVPLEPLMIEWQGDHFERTTSSANASVGSQGTPNSKKSESRASVNASSQARRVAPQPPRELPPAVLVFRDGRTEEVSNYTIMSGTIYSKADYWTTGSWNKKIQIADLDVPATLKLNQQRGLNFVLPAGPDEVVIRP